MRILIANDDGISSPALPHLVRWAKKYGEVTVVVPKFEQSGMSQAIDFRRVTEIKKVDIAPDVTVWSMDSTPADCVRFGVTGLGADYDLVISGVNLGLNLGEDIAYSGTVGVIQEGARLGIRGIAFSAEPHDYEAAIAQMDQVMDFIFENDLFAENGHYNVNIPKESKGFRITRQGGMFYSDAFVCKGNDMYIQVGEPVESKDKDPNIDINAYRNGYISITPIAWEKTAFAAFEKLKDEFN